MNNLQELKPHRKKILKLSATASVLAVSILNPDLGSTPPSDIHGVLIMMSFLFIISAAIIEMREEIERKRIETIQIFYPIQRIIIIFFADALYFIMLPMIAFMFISTVFL